MSGETDYSVVLVLVDWDNLFFQAKDAVHLKYRGKKDLYGYRLLIEMVRISRKTVGTAKELRVLIFTNNANSLPAICYQISKSPGIEVQVIAGASRSRQRDKDTPGKSYDEEDPVDETLLASASAHLESPRVSEIFLASGDGGFTPTAENPWTRGTPWRLITVADVYNPKEHMRMVSERLKRAQLQTPLIIDPQNVVYTDKSTYDFQENTDAAREGTLDILNAEFFLTAFERIKLLVRDARDKMHGDYLQSELIRATWRSLMLDWAPHGFLKRHVKQVVEILKDGDLAKKLNGMLYDPRSQEALERSRGPEGEPAEPQLTWEEGRLPPEIPEIENTS